MTVEGDVGIEIGREDDFSPEEMMVLNSFAEILPRLTKLSVTMNSPLELAIAQGEHVEIVNQAIDMGLLPEICIIRDQFRDALARDGQV